MKNASVKLLSILITSLFFVVSCSDDDNGPSTSNSLTVNGSAFKVTTASIAGVSIDGEGHAGITLSAVEGSTTKVLNLDIEYFVGQSLTGTYSFPQENNRYLDDWLSSYAEYNGSSMVTSNLETGSVVVTDHGNSTFTFTIDVTMDDGKVFKGTYKGKVMTQFNNG